MTDLTKLTAEERMTEEQIAAVHELAALEQKLQETKERLEQCEAALLKARVLLVNEGDPEEDSEMIAEIDALIGNAARAALEGE